MRIKLNETILSASGEICFFSSVTDPIYPNLFRYLVLQILSCGWICWCNSSEITEEYVVFIVNLDNINMKLICEFYTFNRQQQNKRLRHTNVSDKLGSCCISHSWLTSSMTSLIISCHWTFPGNPSSSLFSECSRECLRDRDSISLTASSHHFPISVSTIVATLCWYLLTLDF